jgi:DNA-binding NarL/FixJ family response regulator
VIRVVLVEDHALVRAGLEQLLGGAGDIDTVAVAADGEEAIELVAEHRPDVVLMDLSMPVMNGLAATEALRATQPEPRVVVLTGEGAAAGPKVAAAGAHALVPKDGRSDALLGCLRTVVVGCGCCPHCL